MYHASTPEANGARRNPYPVYAHNPLNDVRPNPIIGWKWLDECGEPCTTLYKDQASALKDLLGYIRWLNGTPNMWERVWWPVRYRFWPLFKRFWLDVSSGGLQ